MNIFAFLTELILGCFNNLNQDSFILMYQYYQKNYQHPDAAHHFRMHTIHGLHDMLKVLSSKRLDAISGGSIIPVLSHPILNSHSIPSLLFSFLFHKAIYLLPGPSIPFLFHVRWLSRPIGYYYINPLPSLPDLQFSSQIFPTLSGEFPY